MIIKYQLTHSPPIALADKENCAKINGGAAAIDRLRDEDVAGIIAAGLSA